MNSIMSMSEDEVLQTSLGALQEDLEEGIFNLSGDLQNTFNTFKEWKQNRIFLIQNLTDISDKLQDIRRKSNVTTVKASSFSLVGGVAVAGGLFATSVISAPLLVAGGIVATFSSIVQIASSANESILSHKWQKQCEKDINKDAESLKQLLKSVDEYIDRIQYLEKLLKEKEELRKTKGVVETVYYGVRFGKSFMEYTKAIDQAEKLLTEGTKVLNVFQKLSKTLKTSDFFKAFFKNTAKNATPKVAGGGLKLFSKRAFVLAGVLFDVISIANAADDLKKDRLPKASEDLIKTVGILIQEKVYIDQVFSQLENEYTEVITIDDSDDESDYESDEREMET